MGQAPRRAFALPSGARSAPLRRHKKPGIDFPSESCDISFDPDAALNSDKVLSIPVQATNTADKYYRTVNVGFDVGIDTLTSAKKATSVLTVVTDVKGNLITCHPGELAGF
jgi:hypothetical protein